MRDTRRDLIVQPGELRHTVELQAQDLTPDTVTGAPPQGPGAGWATFYTAQAAIETASSREVYQAAQFTAQVTHVIKMRWPGEGYSLAGGQRVLFGTRMFQVQTVENVLERNRVVNLHCLEINGVVPA